MLEADGTLWIGFDGLSASLFMLPIEGALGTLTGAGASTKGCLMLVA